MEPRGWGSRHRTACSAAYIGTVDEGAGRDQGEGFFLEDDRAHGNPFLARQLAADAEPSDVPKRALDECQKLGSLGEASAARARLSALAQAPDTEETFRSLRKLNPHADIPTGFSGDAAAVPDVTPALARRAVYSFRQSSGRGPDGLPPILLRHLGRPAPEIFYRALARVLTLFVKGALPPLARAGWRTINIMGILKKALAAMPVPVPVPGVTVPPVPDALVPPCDVPHTSGAPSALADTDVGGLESTGPTICTCSLQGCIGRSVPASYPLRCGHLVHPACSPFATGGIITCTVCGSQAALSCFAPMEAPFSHGSVQRDQIPDVVAWVVMEVAFLRPPRLPMIATGLAENLGLERFHELLEATRGSASQESLRPDAPPTSWVELTGAIDGSRFPLAYESTGILLHSFRPPWCYGTPVGRRLSVQVGSTAGRIGGTKVKVIAASSAPGFWWVESSSGFMMQVPTAVITMPEDGPEVALRPVSVSAALPRAAAKCLTSQTKRQTMEALRDSRQFAMEPGAIEAIPHAFRRRLEQAHAEGERLILIRCDRANAHSTVRREATLTAVQEKLPHLAPYVAGLYQQPIPALMGRRRDQRHEITTGVLQGDSTSGASYCAVTVAWETVVTTHEAVSSPGLPRPEVDASLHDDQHLLGGIASAVARACAMTDTGGFCDQAAKPEKWMAAVTHADMLPEARRRLTSMGVPYDAIKLYAEGGDILGGKFGPEPVRQRLVLEDLAKQERKNRTLARLDSRHVAFSILQQTGSACVAAHAMRTAAVSPSTFTGYDEDLMSVAAEITGLARSPMVDAILTARLRDGGAGIRLAAPFADAAFCASMLETSGLQQRICPALPPAHEDAVFRAAWSRLTNDYPILTGILPSLVQGAASRLVKVQKRLSEPIVAARLAALEGLVSADEEARARLRSAAGNSAWLVPRPSPGDRPEVVGWQTNRDFLFAMAVRTGGAVQEAEHVCRLCRTAVADIRGKHTLSCMGSGCRTRWHTQKKNELFRLASRGMMAPRLEPGVGDAGRRADLAVYLPAHGGDASTLLLDLAITSPFVTPAVTRLAGESIGGAAAAYAERKLATYRSLTLPAGHRVIPIVCDTLGAYDQRSRAVISSMIRRVADVEGEGWARAGPRLWGRLQAAHIAAMGALLSYNFSL